jgi:hypothetical protein
MFPKPQINLINSGSEGWSKFLIHFEGLIDRTQTLA